ncbi:MAG: PH domain-containing protein [Balneolaceae bacterium]|nr:PH domain-containing protein [Balneolaceae bacterium]
MASQSQSKQVTLSPSWKQHFIGYVLSVLTIPIFGLGLIAFYFVRKKHKGTSYKVTDTQISSTDTKYQRNIDLVNIEDVQIQQSWLQEKLGIGTLVLSTSAASMDVVGMEEPEKLKNIIEQAIATQKEQQKKQDVRRHREPKYQPGTMEKMDYLTGLWQQGLISDDDFENEKRISNRSLYFYSQIKGYYGVYFHLPSHHIIKKHLLTTSRQSL